MAKLQLIFKANVMIIQTSENLQSENRPLIRQLSSVDLSDIISMIAFSNSSCELQPLAMPWRNTDARDLTSCDKMLPSCDKLWQFVTSCDKLWQDVAFNDLSRIVTRKSQVNAGSCCPLWVSRSNKVDVELVLHNTCTLYMYHVRKHIWQRILILKPNKQMSAITLHSALLIWTTLRKIGLYWVWKIVIVFCFDVNCVQSSR